ncbi:putative Ankyrin 1 [Chelatococcus asaccharovorans]|nr:putative Ankyrin 1 [Chelatococcus asaccharovorans]CAH1679993.1 putative Ankyrin 1 [Chelatococcus asaccharovorans]
MMPTERSPSPAALDDNETTGLGLPTGGRFNIDYLKKAAKDLKRAARDGDTAALARLTAVCGDSAEPKLSNCLHVIAVEAGFASWPRLRQEVEIRQASLQQLKRSLGSALYQGRLRQAARILEEAPDIADGSVALQLALYDEARINARLDADPAALLAPQKGLPGSDPMFDCLPRLVTSQYFRLRPDLLDAQLRLVRRFIALGADPNARYHEPDENTPLPLLYGAMRVAGNLAVAEALLDAGADPNDGESAYHACEMETLDGLRLLISHGVRFPGTNALFRMLDFDNLEGAELILANGGDPNESTPHLGNALHHAIRRGRDARFLDLLLRYGVDATVRAHGRSAYALAATHGNRSMMEGLAARGLAGDLDATERFLLAVLSGDRREALARWANEPDIVSRLARSEQSMHVELARQPGRLEVLRLMDDVGFDPQAMDREQVTPLQSAAWFGFSDYVAFYLERPHDLSHRNVYGGTALATALHGARHCSGRPRGDYVETVRLLIAAGATLDPKQPFSTIDDDIIEAFEDQQEA